MEATERGGGRGGGGTENPRHGDNKTARYLDLSRTVKPAAKHVWHRLFVEEASGLGEQLFAQETPFVRLVQKV